LLWNNLRRCTRTQLLQHSSRGWRTAGLLKSPRHGLRTGGQFHGLPNGRAQALG